MIRCTRRGLVSALLARGPGHAALPGADGDGLWEDAALAREWVAFGEDVLDASARARGLDPDRLDRDQLVRFAAVPDDPGLPNRRRRATNTLE